MTHHFHSLALGVNIDHVATLRQARRGRYPDPVHAALEAERAGADSITLHLREDRRHIQDRDVHALKDLLKTRMNLELAATDEMVEIARGVSPADCCLVPERRQEITTEGGLHVSSEISKLTEVTARLADKGIRVSLFIDPDPEQIEAVARIRAPVVELHTGTYADATGSHQATELERLRRAAQLASSLGLKVHAGHGLDYHNVQPVAAIADIVELNIGHSIVSRAVFDGLSRAITDMKALMMAARA